jgi:hypothetical protein
MNLAVIAAFTAAAVSFVNIIVTSRLASGSQFRQWQREESGPSPHASPPLRGSQQGMAAGRPDTANPTGYGKDSLMRHPGVA